jgi:hypothetical protein
MRVFRSRTEETIIRVRPRRRKQLLLVPSSSGNLNEDTRGLTMSNGDYEVYWFDKFPQKETKKPGG